METSLYIFLNKDIPMTTGEATAQASHVTAELGAHPDRVVVLTCDAETMKNIHSYSRLKHFDNAFYVEEGTGGIPPFSLTAVAVFLTTEKGKKLFKDLPLYAESKPVATKIKVEFLDD